MDYLWVLMQQKNKILGSFFILSIFCVQISHGAIGDDVNRWLDFFWNQEESSTQANDSGETPSSDLEIPVVPIPGSPTQEDLKSVRGSILQVESELAEIESKLETAEKRQDFLVSELDRIDQELAWLGQETETQNQAKALVFQDVEQARASLTELARQKTFLRAEIRVLQRQVDDWRAGLYWQEHWKKGLGWLVWVFSDQMLSDFRYQLQAQRSAEEKYQRILHDLEMKKRDLDRSEIESALLLKVMQDEYDQSAGASKHAKDLWNLRQTMIGALAKEQAALRTQSGVLRGRQAYYTQWLENLRFALEEIEIKMELKDPVVETDAVSELSKWRWPLDGEIEITAGFLDPEYQRLLGRRHDGVDLKAPQGTNILAPTEGTVYKVSEQGYGYSSIILRHHEQNLYSVYGHVSEILVLEGESVTQSQIIAKTGGTPGTIGAGDWTTGPHLHWAVYDDEGFVDPQTLLR